MPTQQLTSRMEHIRTRLAGPHNDIEGLHDAVQILIEDLKRHHDAVPTDLRMAVDELEAEILEAFHDNLPV
ncbi:hypothetical protein [Meridianimarinicoccus aquatilis]|uniref:DUF4404 family protein n=1 Tax=Meridianimarinicoccus aquatilis TaxID=2552766 RepID=A0A4R6B009_9RHOB|nr:hypothetical protein [Fluviibacterium aquatile]QIE41853.1 hypothetical protein G5B39_07720 [Rhodobacteraceae bacterium SC52]TDL89435.1 hypothetical protein E2L05_06070 [Fluviibacterium aquatile]